MGSLYGWLYDRWRRSWLRGWVRTLRTYQMWHEARFANWLGRLRTRTRPVRYAVRRGLRDPRRIQRSALLAPEDQVAKRKRQHVLVDLVYEHCPASEVLMAEIGTASGKTSAHLVKYCPQIKLLVAVDLEAPDPDDDHIRNLDKVRFIKGRSDEVATQFEDEFFDIVFVDADHSEEWVDRDLQAWFSKVREGGIIAGHDYGTNHYPGVRIAVDRFFANHPYPVRIEANKLWWTFRA